MSEQALKKEAKITVFYDGKCGLCSKEINHYKRIEPKGVFKWIDITSEPETFEKLGYKKEDGLRALHAQDTDGNIHIGIDAFILIWQQLKRWRCWAIFLSLPIIKQITEFTYKHFANWRFNKLGYGRCSIDN